MDKAHDVQILKFQDALMHLKIDGKEYEFDLAAHSKRLSKATQAERENVEISPSGYGLHWTDVDEDLSIDSLIGVTHLPPFAKPKIQ
jgi:uncharacterized protein DUF2442